MCVCISVCVCVCVHVCVCVCVCVCVYVFVCVRAYAWVCAKWLMKTCTGRGGESTLRVCPHTVHECRPSGAMLRGLLQQALIPCPRSCRRTNFIYTLLFWLIHARDRPCSVAGRKNARFVATRARVRACVLGASARTDAMRKPRGACYLSAWPPGRGHTSGSDPQFPYVLSDFPFGCHTFEPMDLTASGTTSTSDAHCLRNNFYFRCFFMLFFF